MENSFLTALTGQSTHEDLVQKSGLQHILFDKSCLRRILFHNKSGLRRILFIKIPLLNLSGMQFISSIYSVYQFISSENDLNSNAEWSQRHNLYQTVIKTILNNKPFVKSNLLRCKSHNTILLFQNNLLETTYVNTCNIIVANTRLISILFRLHAVSSRLLQNLWHRNGPEQEASEFLCTKTTLFRESWATKKIAKNPRKCSLQRATNVVFSKFHGWRRIKKKPRSAQFFETALRAVLLN